MVILGYLLFPVNTDRLDNIFNKFFKKIAMIKVDVEGHELSVIEDAIKIIHTHNPLIYIEILGRSVFDRIYELLSFEYVSYAPILEKPINLDCTDWDCQNILFVP